MASRKGALAQTDRLWLGCGSGPLNSAPKSVITSLAGFAGVGSVITSFLAGFGRLRPHPPGCPTGIPAALRYAPMVSRRMCTARSICRSDHPRRPKAITCCLFSSFKTLLTSTEGIALRVGLNVPSAWLLAGFQVIMYGRFWVITEAIVMIFPLRSRVRVTLQNPPVALTVYVRPSRKYKVPGTQIL